MKNKIKEITPAKFQCVVGSCPAVFTVNDSTKLAIIGKKVSPESLGITNRVGDDEQVIIIDREMIRQLFND